MPGVPVATGCTDPMELAVEPQSLKKLSFKSLKRALDLFAPVHGHPPHPDPVSKQVRIGYKIRAEYGAVAGSSTGDQRVDQTANAAQGKGDQPASTSMALALPSSLDSRGSGATLERNAIVPAPAMLPKGPEIDISRNAGSITSISERPQSTSALAERIASRWPRPEWHAPWKNYRAEILVDSTKRRLEGLISSKGMQAGSYPPFTVAAKGQKVISGHLGWVRSIAFDPGNEWFCTGSADRTIKIWDTATGKLKLTLTGHIEQIRGLAVSKEHTYLFSAGDDKQVKCWDLEQNKVIRSYHGHLSGVYCLALHPTIDALFTGGRDSVCRVWDIRTKAMVMALSGHDNTVCSVFARPTDPQVVTGSHDSTIKFWDLAAGKTMLTLTHHKKSVRAMALHPTERSFASASADNIKKFKLPKGEFLHNMDQRKRNGVV